MRLNYMLLQKKKKYLMSLYILRPVKHKQSKWGKLCHFFSAAQQARSSPSFTLLARPWPLHLRTVNTAFVLLFVSCYTQNGNLFSDIFDETCTVGWMNEWLNEWMDDTFWYFRMCRPSNILGDLYIKSIFRLVFCCYDCWQEGKYPANI